ncbi:COG2-domain-containing protein [Microstroma glucosiphilum]|uniref:COG2-domain-containing protein n=1 Tax=Pseudomicrostroma glucosiphilum TaxID=1684307 RepID=A0A316UGP1_9BASI|nr:COG2-domain-containing protein [Pseudomicrostroma glucosiphilum]PWN24094.1 COG2-domain-containing protein [Pseudomicrostroma glucosiphilum]
MATTEHLEYEHDHTRPDNHHMTLPSATPLSHSSPALRAGEVFNPSDLLCSLLPASLGSHSKQLTAYDDQLSGELETVVDDEYKEFIALAARLGGERQRIDRLAHWAGDSGQEGLEGVRLCVDKERDEVMAAQSDVLHLLTSRQAIETRKTDLRALLSFSDTVQRLEGLLLIPTGAEVASSSARATANPSPRPHHGSASRASGRPHEDDDDLIRRMKGERHPNNEQNGGDRSSLEDELGTYDSDASSSAVNRRNLANVALQSEAMPKAAPQKQLHHTGRNLDLPTRIARAKTTWESLDFLRRAAAKLPAHAKDAQILEGSSSALSNKVPFLERHEQRLSAIQTTLKGDLRSLFSRLMTPGALLVEIDEPAGLVSNPNSIGDLDRWSRIAPGLSQSQALSEKMKERKTWMIMLLEAWTSIGTDVETSITEVQEHLCEKFVAPWCQDFVRLDRDVRNTHFRALASSAASHLQVNGGPPLLHTDDTRDMSPFLPMFNTIIRFVHSMRGLTALLESFDPIGNRPKTLLSSDESNESARKRHSRIQPFEAVIWSSISTALIGQVGERLFYVGAPDEFHRNYTTTQDFLDILSHYCPSAEAKRAWREHPSFLAFMKRWQLSVYFQMRYRSIATSFESELAPMPRSFATPKEAQPLPLLTATQSAIVAFVAPWSRSAHLTPLIARQLKLSLMVVARYYTWMCDQQMLLTKVEGQVDELNAVSNRQFAISQGGGAIPSRSATPDLDSQTLDERSLKALAILAADAVWFRSEAARRLKEDIIPMTSSTRGWSEEASTLPSEISAALTDAFPYESRLLPSVGAAIVSLLKSRCAEALRLVRSINTQYRGGTSGPSTPNAELLSSQVEPSYFVPQIFRPLRAFLGKGDRSGEQFMTPGRLVAKEYRLSWATEVVDDVAMRYAASLTQMIQNYESLRRLKRGNMTGSGGFGGLASSFFRGGSNFSNQTAPGTSNGDDSEWVRMQVQMRVDVARLEQDLKELGEVGVDIDLDRSEPWSKLRALAAGQDRV